MTRNTSPTTPHTLTEVFPTAQGLPLRLSLTPDAIREHFEDDDSPEAQAVRHLSEEELVSAAVLALNDDGLYAAFHTALTRAVQQVTESPAATAPRIRT